MLAVGGCVSTGHPLTEQAAAPPFDPIVFFAGRTEGRGRLKIAFKRPHVTLVEGRGRVNGDGTITLDQTVRRGYAAPTRRTWNLRRVAPGQYVGSLTDATGPVTGKVVGSQLHLAFAMKGGTRAEQWLYLQPGGRTARNIMIVRKLGLPVARLDETITRQ